MAKDKKPSVTQEQLGKMLPHGLTLSTPQGATIALPVRGFKTGSYGCAYNGPLTVVLDGVPVEFQANVNLIVKHSKPADEKAAA